MKTMEFPSAKNENSFTEERSFIADYLPIPLFNTAETI